MGYSNESKFSRAFNVNSQIIEESILVIFDDEFHPNNHIDHPSSILHELTHYPSVDFVIIEPVIPLDQDLFCHLLNLHNILLKSMIPLLKSLKALLLKIMKVPHEILRDILSI